MKFFNTRAQVAEYLRISRMTLSRWEKIVPIVERWPRTHMPSMDSDDIDAWYRKLREKYRPKQESIKLRTPRLAV